MADSIEKLIDSLFLEPYGLDDCMELGRILNNKGIDLKEDVDIYDTITDEKTKKAKKVKKTINKSEALDISVSHEIVFDKIKINGKEYKRRDYVCSYRLHSNTAISILDFFINNARERSRKEYLENKIISFFKSYEWETWAWKYAENGSDSLTYSAKKSAARK
jgi:hypothetical protein